MKKRLLICSAILLSATMFVGGVYAANNYSIFINGKQLKAEVKVINNTTYVPLRAVSEALGAKVNFNSSTNRIDISLPSVASGTNNTPTQPSQEVAQATRKNPAKVGEVIPFVTTSNSNRITGSISITQAIRGEQAWKMIHDANSFNDLPDVGYEYILVKIKYSVATNANSDSAVDVTAYDFDLVSGDGVDYPKLSVVVPEPQFRTKIYEGGSFEGWAAFKVKTSDSDPLLAYNRKYDGSNGIWFSLK